MVTELLHSSPACPLGAIVLYSIFRQPACRDSITAALYKRGDFLQFLRNELLQKKKNRTGLLLKTKNLSMMGG